VGQVGSRASEYGVAPGEELGTLANQELVAPGARDGFCGEVRREGHRRHDFFTVGAIASDEELPPPRIEDWEPVFRAIGRDCGGHCEQRTDAPDGPRKAEADPLCEGDADPQPRKRTGTDTNGDEVEGGSRPPRERQGLLEEAEERLTMGARLFTGRDCHLAPAFDQGEAASPAGSFDREGAHHCASTTARPGRGWRTANAGCGACVPSRAGSDLASRYSLPRVPQIVPRFDFRLDYAVAEDIGRRREHNEDAYLIAPEYALFAVADGMGGHAAGELASRLAVEAVRESIAGETSQRVIDAYVRVPTLETRRNVFARLRRAVEFANEKVRAAAEEGQERLGMGTTLDVVWLARNHAFVAHAGDSRVYLARSNAVLQLTQDHAEHEAMRASGLLSPHARTHSLNRLMNAVGLKDSVAVDTLFVDVTRGDRLLLCTDGVHGQVAGESELSDLLRAPSPEQAARGLVARAGVRGRDNATAVIIEVCDTFVRRQVSDRGVRAKDLERAKSSPLLVDLPVSKAMGALAAAVEVEVTEGELVPQVVASDMVCYIVLDGLVRVAPRRLVSVGALIFPESLVGVTALGELPVTESPTRLLRLRGDDFNEVCNADPALGKALFQRLATHLARGLQAVRPVPGRNSSVPPPPSGERAPSSLDEPLASIPTEKRAAEPPLEVEEAGPVAAAVDATSPGEGSRAGPDDAPNTSSAPSTTKR
jgi:PPM family protein phosphatase